MSFFRGGTSGRSSEGYEKLELLEDVLSIKGSWRKRRREEDSEDADVDVKQRREEYVSSDGDSSSGSSDEEDLKSGRVRRAKKRKLEPQITISDSDGSNDSEADSFSKMVEFITGKKTKIGEPQSETDTSVESVGSTSHGSQFGDGDMSVEYMGQSSRSDKSSISSRKTEQAICGTRTTELKDSCDDEQNHAANNIRDENHTVTCESAGDEREHAAESQQNDYNNVWGSDSESDESYHPPSVEPEDIPLASDAESTSSYEVEVPKTAAQLLNEYQSEDSDDSWTPY